MVALHQRYFNVVLYWQCIVFLTLKAFTHMMSEWASKFIVSNHFFHTDSDVNLLRDLQ